MNVVNLNKPEPEDSQYTYVSLHNCAIMLDVFMEINKDVRRVSNICYCKNQYQLNQGAIVVVIVW